MYNGSIHSTTGFSPVRLHTGRVLRRPIDDLGFQPKAPLVPGTREFAQEYQRDVEEARKNMYKAQERMIRQANKRRRPSTIRTGDFVWVQMKEFTREEDFSRKLLPTYYGPWQVLGTVGTDPFGPTYVIDVPGHLETHPVFHASKLLPFHASDVFPDRPSQMPPPIPGRGYEVERIEDHSGEGSAREYLVRFLYCPPSESRWFSRRELLRTAKNIVIHYENRLAGTLPRRSRRLLGGPR